jgi:hypothetical protein
MDLLFTNHNKSPSFALAIKPFANENFEVIPQMDFEEDALK